MKVIIICALTLDGKIARGATDPVDWTSKEDKKIFAKETKKAGVVIMGHNTFQAIGQPLRDRLNVVFASQLEGLREMPGVLEYVSGSPEGIVRSLARRGFKRAFVIGGSRVNSLFLSKDLVDEIWLTLVPRLFGRGVGFSAGTFGSRSADLVSVKRLGRSGELLLRYRLS